METALQQKSCCLCYCRHVSFSPNASSRQVGFDRSAAVPCDSALICWWSLAVVPSKRCKILQSSTAGFHLFVKVPGSWTRIKNHLQAEGNECVTSDEDQLCRISAMEKVWNTSERAEASAIRTYFNVTHLKLSLWWNRSFGCCCALETQRFIRTNIHVVFVGSFESFNVGDYFFLFNPEAIFSVLMTHI